LSQWPQGRPSSSPKQASRLGQRDHRLQPPAHDPALRLGGGRLRQEPARPGDVLAAVKQQRIGPLAVAAGAADLLVIRLRAVRHVEMDDEADVRPVDPHAEGDGRHHDHRLAAAEPGQADPLLQRR